MALKTRLDGRSPDNNSFKIVDAIGTVVVEVKLLGKAGTTLEINTCEGLHVRKPSGWDSRRRNKNGMP